MTQQDDYLDGIRHLIKKYGWAVQGVFPGPDDDMTIYAYTIGLSLKGHAEILISGLPPDSAKMILNDLAQRVIDNGEDLPLNTPMGDVVQGYDVLVIPVSSPGEHVAVAARILDETIRGARPAVVQVVWPDPNGKFPWEPECVTTGAAQEVLGVTPKFGT